MTEPNGTTYIGSVGVIGPTNETAGSYWFTPDEAAGVSIVWYTGNVTLYVKK